MKRSIKALIATLTIAAALPAVAQNRSGGCAAVVAGSPERNRGSFQESFKATEVIDIDLSVLFTPGTINRFAGDHEVQVRIFTPNGHFYQAIDVPFTADSTPKGRQRKLEGYPLPVDVQSLTEVERKGSKHYAVSARLPVAGTLITSNSIYGQWSAVAFVDGESLGCSSPASFTISQ
jgi:hypothetical protein